MGNVRDLGLLALRVGFGAAAASHGAQKLFGWFGGHGLDGTGAFFDSVGFKPGKRNATLAGLAEGGGGALIALGLGTGPAGLALASNMVVASSTHVSNGFFGQDGGYELPAAYGVVGSVLALTGPGRYSLDALTGGVLNKPWLRTVVAVGGLASAVYVIRARREVLASQPAEPPAEPTAQDEGTDEPGA